MNLVSMTAMNPEAIVQSDTTVFKPPLMFLAVFAVNGTIKIQNELGQDVTFTIPSVANGGGAPFVLPGRIRKVYNTDTTIADAALIGYRQSQKNPNP